MTGLVSPARLLSVVRRFCWPKGITGRQFGRRFAGDAELTDKLARGLRLNRKTTMAVQRVLRADLKAQDEGNR